MSFLGLDDFNVDYHHLLDPRSIFFFLYPPLESSYLIYSTEKEFTNTSNSHDENLTFYRY